jgi:nitrogen fixation protein FixH
MKRTWEYAVGAFFVLFIAGVLGFVFVTLDDRNDLVVEHYYDAEIEYQRQIDKVDRTRALAHQPTIQLTDAGIRIDFPRSFRSRELTGIIHVYRPDDKRMDLSFPVGPDTANVQLIPTTLLQPGRWDVKVEWSGKGVEYYSEERVVVKGQQR